MSWIKLWSFVLASFLIISATANYSSQQLIQDFFDYKGVTSIVGFPCFNVTEKFDFMRTLSSSGKTAIIDDLDSRVNVQSPTTQADHHRLGIFIEAGCYNPQLLASAFFKAGSYRLYNGLHVWLIIADDLNFVLTLINDTAFSYSTEFVVAIPEASSDDYQFQLYDLYNPGSRHGGELHTDFMGTWRRSTGVIETFTIIDKFTRRANLQGLTLKVFFYGSQYRKNQSLEEFLQDSSTGARDGLSKFGYIVVKYFSEMYNLSLILGEIAKWQPGDRVGPFVRALSNNDIDMNGSPMTMNAERTRIVKFIYPTWPFRTCFMFRNPQLRDIKVTEVTGPFENKCWFLIFAFMLGTIPLLEVVLRNEDVEFASHRISNAALILISSLCQQGTEYKFDKISSRIAFLSILLFSFLIFNYYSASVVSARFDEPIYKINDSLNQLGKLNLQMSTEWMIFFNFFIQRDDWDTKTFYTNFWQKIPEENKITKADETMPLVHQGGYAFHTYPDTGYPYVAKHWDNHEICELNEVHLVQPTFWSLALNLNSSLIEITKIGFAWISEVGIRSRQLTKFTVPKPICRKDVLYAASITIEEFAPHLLLLLGGMIAAVLICIVENFIHYQFRRFDKLL